VRVGIISDIHSNLPALEAVLADMGPVDQLWCLGDFVGYGPWPNECLALLMDRGVVAIAGNHDLAAIGRISTYSFNLDAAIATQWTTEQLTPEHAEYLRGLDPRRSVHGVTLAHGSPKQPIWEYLLDDRGAAESFDHFDTPLCFVGHTHIPSVFMMQDDGHLAVGHMAEGSCIRPGDRRAIANPGSVGQPRDRDPRSSYLLYNADQRSLEWHRVEYEIKRTQSRMHEVDLPAFFSERLSIGA
jgi:predicted phosphodiesterase